MEARRLTEEEFRHHFERVPRLCVDAVIRKEGGVVLARRSLPSWSGLWSMPGGTVYYHETIVDAVRRLAKEEAGLEVVVGQLIGYMEFLDEEKERGFGYSVSIVMLCDAVGGEMRYNGDASDIRIFHIPSELPENTVPEHRALLVKNWDKIAEGMPMK